MGQSNRLRLSDVRSIMRLLGDARDLRYDGPAQRRMLVNGLGRLIGGHNGFSVLFEHFVTGGHPVPTELIVGGVFDPDWIHYTSAEWCQYDAMDDPMVAATLGKSSDITVAVRTRIMTDREYRGYPAYEQLLGPCRVNDLLVTFYPRGPGQIRGYALHRRMGERNFSLREQRIGQLFITELSRLDRAGKLEVRPPGGGRLAPRQSQLLAHLARGRAPKQIARDLGLSVETVRTYLRDLYRKMDVSGRDELIAQVLMGYRGGDTSSM